MVSWEKGGNNMLFKEKLANFFGLTEIDDDEIIYKDFGTLLKTVRTSADMTSSELAEKSQISQSYISQLENNIRLPSDKVIKKLAYGLVERNNTNANVLEMRFSSDRKKEVFNDLVNQFIQVRNYMRIKDVPGLVETDIGNDTIMIGPAAKDFLKLFEKIPAKERDNLFSYMNFLIKKEQADEQQKI
ncbi:DNA-binding helix-turn-helix protein [Enterococcus casseliflavus ATCC 12755]|uniref:DNA-binding helix-turn-helix protein n=2 Tax=Enterococcus casseliflavus TaxID=37734 RepID=F0EJF6_ENTCA|nr:DNA-binding helix-turn-helix protein [Enterococcus casseliflavus ATCC 12755]